MDEMNALQHLFPRKSLEVEVELMLIHLLAKCSSSSSSSSSSQTPRTKLPMGPTWVQPVDWFKSNYKTHSYTHLHLNLVHGVTV